MVLKAVTGGGGGGIVNPVTITGGTIDNTVIGGTTPANGRIIPVVVDVTDVTKTLALTDAETIQACSNVASQTITIPANASVAFPTNTVIIFEQNGAGIVTITGDTGVTVNGISAGSVESTGQYTGFYLRKISTNTWEAVSGTNGITSLTGDVTASGIGSVAATVHSIGGKSVVLSGTFTTSGAFNTTLTVTADTNVTLPTSGTLLTNDMSNVGTIAHNLIFTDATYDIGASGATRPRSIYLSSTVTAVTGTITGNMTVGGTFTGSGSVLAGASSNLSFSTTRSKINSPADGDLMMVNAAQNGFTSLKFGGTTSSFPELKRSSAALICRLADDSADAAFTASVMTVSADNGGKFTNQTSDAGAGAGTITNSPTAGDPAFWLRVTINGSNYAIPAWIA